MQDQVGGPAGMPIRHAGPGKPADSTGPVGSPRQSSGRLRATVTDALRRQHELVQAPLLYAVVIDVLDHVPGDLSQDGLPTFGTPVRVSASENAAMVGKCGVALHDPDDQGEILVSFPDGTLGSFGAGIPDAKNPKKELEIDPTHRRRVVVALDQRHLLVQYPQGASIEIGDTVGLNQSTLQIVSVIGHRQYGEVGTVQRVLDNATCEVEIRQTIRLVSVGAFAGKLEGRQRVLVDQSVAVVLDILKGDDDRFLLQQPTGVTFDDIGGHDQAKAMLRETITRPAQYPELFAHHKKRLIRGCLLFGPPGCGKTELGKAAATELSTIHLAQHPDAADAPSGFLYINASEILEHLVGKAEKTVRALGEWGQKFLAMYGYRPIIFIDEAESVLRKRGTGVSSDATDTIVTAFLGLLGGMRDPGAFFILATNRPDILDPALVRDGRLDRKIVVPRPGRQDAELIFRIHLKRSTIADGATVEELAAFAADELFKDDYALYRIEPKPESGKTTILLTLGRMTSGAMIAGVVDRASSLALERDITQHTMTGIAKDDLVATIREKFAENQSLNHDDELREAIGDTPVPFGGITKLRQARG